MSKKNIKSLLKYTAIALMLCIIYSFFIIRFKKISTLPIASNLIAESNINELGIKLSYPKEWGNLIASKGSDFTYIEFSNLTLIKDGFLKLTINSLVNIENYAQNMQREYGDLTPEYNLSHYKNLKNNFDKFDNTFQKKILDSAMDGKRMKLSKIKIANRDYITYLDFQWRGDWGLYKKWISFIDDKIIIATLYGNSFTDTYAIDQLVYPTPGHPNIEYMRKAKYEDLKINEAEISKAIINAEKILSAIFFSKINSL